MRYYTTYGGRVGERRRRRPIIYSSPFSTDGGDNRTLGYTARPVLIADSSLQSAFVASDGTGRDGTGRDGGASGKGGFRDRVGGGSKRPFPGPATRSDRIINKGGRALTPGGGTVPDKRPADKVHVPRFPLLRSLSRDNNTNNNNHDDYRYYRVLRAAAHSRRRAVKTHSVASPIVRIRVRTRTSD